MDDYQKFLIDEFKEFRPQPEYPVYPPYHVGPYLEDYFFNFFIENNLLTNRYFIPVSWTTCYIQNNTLNLQNKLNSLDLNKKYFTVAQHDDAVKEILPLETICFNAGGNGGGIPIPLICSEIKEEIKPNTKKEIFCSFVGSATHRIRFKMIESLRHKEKYKLFVKNWQPSVGKADFDFFIETTSKSVFCLCPRGYGKSSFRLYEAMQLGSIPVYIYDEKWCPFEEELDWSQFCILIEEKDISKIDEILSSIPEEKITKIQNSINNIWSNNFTMEAVCKKIINRL